MVSRMQTVIAEKAKKKNNFIADLKHLTSRLLFYHYNKK